MANAMSHLRMNHNFRPPPDVPDNPEPERITLMSVSHLRRIRRLAEPGREDPAQFKCHHCDARITGNFCFRFSGCMFPDAQIVHWLCNDCKERCLGENGRKRIAWRCIHCGVYISDRAINPLESPFIRHKIPGDVRRQVRGILKKEEQHQQKLLGAIKQRQADNLYHCGLCEKTFKTSYGRKKHMQIHGESPTCAACKREFTTAESLKRHEMKKSCKSMEELIPCRHCGKEFSRTRGFNRRRHEAKCNKSASSYKLKRMAVSLNKV